MQLKVNKRNQIKRDKARGLKRVEFKVSSQLYQALRYGMRRILAVAR